MAKYIDAEKLRKLLANRYEEITVPILTDEGGLESFYRRSEIHNILKIVDSLQQEQNSIQDSELTGFESALFTAFSYAWQSYLRGEEVNVVQWAKENSAELLEAARCQQEQQEEPDKSLEEEIETWIPAHISVKTDETLSVNSTEIADACKEWGKCVARHFVEWGAEHLKK